MEYLQTLPTQPMELLPKTTPQETTEEPIYHPHPQEPINYLKFERSQCFCDYKQPPLPPHLAGLFMHIHYQYVHVYKAK